jgi:MtfA peptidase
MENELLFINLVALIIIALILHNNYVRKKKLLKTQKIPGRRYNFAGQEENLDRLFSNRFDFYKKLPQDKKKVFVKRVIYFIHTSFFVPRNGVHMTADMVSLFSASFVQLTFGMSKKVLKHFNTIIMYPEKFYSSHTKLYHKGDINLLGHISVSWKDFMHGYNDLSDGINLGLHELAHALSMEVLKYKNIYADLFENIKPIYVLAQQEISGKIPRNNFLRDYAFTNIHEYFAVATENYFERNKEMEENSNELYQKMKKFYNPANA